MIEAVKRKVFSAFSVFMAVAVGLMSFSANLTARADSPWTGTWDSTANGSLITNVELFDLSKTSTQAAGSIVGSEMTQVYDVTGADNKIIPAGTIYKAGDTLPALLSSTVKYTLAPVITDATTGIDKSGNVRILYTFAIPDDVTLTDQTTYQFTIPKEVALQSAVTNMPLNADGIGAVANVNIPANPPGDASTGTITFTEASNGHIDRHGAFFVDSQFSNMDNENTTPVSIPFAVQGKSDPLTVNVYFAQPAPTILKGGSFDSASSNINWVVTANDKQTTVTNGYITDQVPSGLSYVPGTFTVTDTTTGGEPVFKDSSTTAGEDISAGNFTYTQSTATLKYVLPTPTSHVYQVAYASSVPSDQYGKSFTNTANLYYNGNSTPVSSNATLTPSPNYITKSGSASVVNGKQQITWTIPFNNDGGTLQNVVITDPYINNGTAAPVGSSIVSVGYAAGAASATPIGIDSSSTPYYTDSNGTLTVNFGDVTGAHTLVFTVQFPDNYLQTNQDGSFTNTATLKADNNAYLQGGVPATNGTGVGTGNTMLRKSGSPDYTSGEINWTVKVNESNRTMAAAQLKDVIGDNHNYVPGTFKVIDNTTSEQVFKDSSTVSIGTDINSGNFSYTASTKTLLYTFPTAKSDQYTVTYSTKLDSSQNQVYAGNTSGSYSNTATLTPDINTPSVSTTVNPPQSYATNVLSKSGTGFDYNTHELSWNITVNSAQYPLTNVVVTDALTDNSLKSPNQQAGDPEYAFDFDANQSVTVTTGSTSMKLTADTTGTPGAGQYYYNGSTRTLTFNLGDLNDSTPANRTKTINFQMKLMDSVDHYFAMNSSTTLNNTATVTSNENNNPTSALGSQTIGNTVIGKGAVYTNNNKYIDWNVQINQNSANIGSGVALADTLQSGLLLDTSSVKLYPQTQAADGSMTPSGSRDQNGLLQNPSTPVTLSGANVAYDVSTNKFVFTMPAGNVSTPYLLTFRTYIDTTVITNNTTVNNTITLSGSTAATEDSQNASTTYTQNAGGYATGVTGQITLQKTDRANGKVLAGAQFSLYDQYGNHLRDVTTGGDGTVTLPYLAYSIPYRLVETGAPTGYDNNNSAAYWFEYINDGNSTGHIQQITSATDATAIGSPTASSGSPTLPFSDAMKTATVQFTKQGDGGTGLAGAQFTLTGTALNGTAVSLTSNATLSDGLVTFSNVPYSDANGYTITETKIPSGYTTIAPLTGVMVSDNTAASGTYALPSQTDGPAGNLTVTKADTDGNGTLEGAVFQLFTGGNANTSGAPAYTSDVTGTNGQAVFTGIPAGTYTLHENIAPTGYMAAPDQNVTIDSNATVSVRLSTAVTVSDQRQTGSISFTKTDGVTPLAGAQFAAYYDQAGNYPVKVNGQTVVSTGSDNTSALTLADGVVIFAGFPYATDSANGYPSGFWVREVVTPANHTTAAPFQVALTSAGSNAPGSVTDTVKTANVQFNKTDGASALDGAAFALFDDAAMSNQIGAATSTGGTVTFKNVPYSANAYYVKEQNTPNNDTHYQKAASFSFTLNDNSAINNGVLRLASANTIGIGAASTPVDANGNVVDTPLGSITMSKVDAVTNKALPTAIFQLLAADHTTVKASGTTDANGSITFDSLPLNATGDTVFYLHETAAPIGYTLAGDTKVALNYSNNKAKLTNLDVNQTVADSLKTATVQFTKLGDHGDSSGLAGAQFTLTGTAQNGTPVTSTSNMTGSDGVVTFSGVLYSDANGYTITETKTPAGYTAVAPLTGVVVSDSTVANGTYTLPSKTDGPAGNLLVTKVDADNAAIAIQGAVFALFNGGNADTSGTPAYTSAATGANGQTAFTGIPAGTYTLHESAAPTGYTAAPDQNVTIDSNAAASVRLATPATVKDLRQTGSLIFTKTDGVKALAGAQFAAYYDEAGNNPVKVNGKVVVSTGSDGTSALTLADGVVKFANFPYATDTANGYPSGFWVREVVTPANYTAAVPFQVALTSAGSNAPTTVADTLKTANVQFNKTDGANALDGATFGLYTDATMNNSIATATSTGGAVTFDNVPYSDSAYYVKELNTPDDVHYQKAASFFFTLNDNSTVNNGVLQLTSANTVGIGAAATPVDANGNVADTPLGSITVSKVDGVTNNALSTAIFQLLAADHTTVKASGMTDTNGSIKFSNLSLNVTGDTVFYLHEITAPIGYNLASDTKVTLNYSNNKAALSNLDVNQTVNDSLKTATIQLTKLGDHGDSSGLAGAQFTLTGAAQNGTSVNMASNVTGSDGLVTFNNVPYSDDTGYTITETTTPNGYTAIAPLTDVVLGDATVYKGVRSIGSWTDGPAGNLQVTKVDADNASITIQGAVFELFTGGNADTSGTPAYTSVATGANGQTAFTGIPAGTYTLHESAVPTGYTAAADQNVTIDSNAAASVRLATSAKVKDLRQTGSLIFTKTDGVKALAGAQFAAYYDEAGTNPVKVNGQVVVSTGSDGTSALTLADGVVKFANFPYATDTANGYPGGFWVREVVTPANYTAAVPFQVALTSAGSNAPTTVADTLKTANVQFNKTDGANALDGATFGLYTDAAMSNSIATATSTGGAVTFGNVPYSDSAYYIKELNTPDDVHYQKAASFFFTLNDNSTVNNGVLQLTSANTVGIGAAATPVDANGNVVDTPLGSITVQKQDAQTGAPLAGAVFQVKSAYDGKTYTAYTANADGSVTFGNLPLNPNATKQTSFTVIETTAPQNYEQNTYSGKNLTISLQNAAGKRDSALTPYLDTKKAGTINLTKVDQNNQPLAGAEFTLFQTVNGVEQTVQGPVISNGSGLVQFTGVPYGSYYIRETKVPADYTGDTAKQIPVVLDDQNPSGTIVTNGTSHTLNVGSVSNTIKTGSVQFTKKAPDGSNLAGAVFTLTGAGGYTQQVTSDQAGLVKFTDVPYGEYTLTETGAPADYTIVAPVPVSLHDSTTNNTGSLTMNDMVDALKTGTIQFTKMAENGGTLSGAAFTLTGAGGYTQQVTSDQNGLVRFTGVPYGDYTIAETGVPAHYVAVSPMTVSLHDSNTAIQNGTLTLGNVTDLLQRGDVVIHDEDNNGKPQPGDTITIYDNNGKEIATGKTDSNGNLVFHDLPYGAYTVVNGGGGTASVALGGATSTATLVANPYTGAAGAIPPYAALGLFGLSLGGVLLGLKRKRKQ